MTDYCDKKFQSDFIWILKALAVLSIISAHVSGIGNTTTNRVAVAMSLFMQSFGAVGVGVFFFLSGYLYPFSRQKYTSFASFFRKKATMLIPWFFCGTLVYLYVAVRKGFHIIELLTSVLGYYSSFWYMSILWILMLIFFQLYKSRLFLVISILLSIISSVIVGSQILPQTVFHVYLNPFNWMIWFSLGIIINEIGLDKLLRIVEKFKLPLSILMPLCFALLALWGGNCHSYFQAWYIPVELLSILALIAISLYIARVRARTLFIDVGKKSFSIYLLHQFGFAGFSVSLLNRFGLWWTTPIRPFLVCMMVYWCIHLGSFISKKLHWAKIYCLLIGGRQ